MANPTPIIVTDSNGHAYVISGASSGAQVAAPTPVVLTDANGNALVLGAGSLPSGTTGVTQAAGDNSTLLATDQFVTTAVANAIAGVNPAVAVLAASTANVVGTYAQVGGGVGDTFTVTATGAFSLDGVAINTLGQRVLLKNQNTGSQNGIYTCTTVGTTGVSAVFTRAADYNTVASINNTGAIPVQSGTGNTTTSWLLTSQVTSVGSSGSSLVFAQFSYAPANIVQTSTTVNGHALSANVTVSASDITTGTLPHAQLPSLVSGDIPNNAANTTGTASNVSGTPALPNGTTATTQAALSNDTKIATDAYADAAVSVETTRATTAEALKAPLASPALTGHPTGVTESPFTNSTRLATTAYVDDIFKGVDITGFREDFLNVVTGTYTTRAVLVCDGGWQATQISGGTQTVTAATDSFANPGQLEITTSAVSGQGLSIFKAGGANPPCGNLGGNAGWELNVIFKLIQTTNCAVRLGFATTDGTADPPVDGIYMEYDTANTGNTNTDFTWVTRVGGTPTYSTTDAIPADTNFHHLRIRSTVAGTIGFTIDGGTEFTTTTGVTSAVVGPFMAMLTRTSSTASLVADFISYMAATGRS